MSNHLDVTDPDEAIQFCDELTEDLGRIPVAGDEFATSVREKVESMREWIDVHCAVSQGIADALLNMRRAVDRWIDR